MDQLRGMFNGIMAGVGRNVIVGCVLAATLGVGVVVVAASTAGSPSASPTVSDADAGGDAPEIGLPQIGDQPGGETNVDAAAASELGDGAGSTEPGVERIVDGDVDGDAAGDGGGDDPLVVQLGEFGTAELELTPDGIEVISTVMVDDWTIESTSEVDGEIVMIIRSGDDLKTITIRRGGPDGVSIAVDEFVLPAIPTTAPPTTTEPPASQPVEENERITVEAPGKGAYVAELDGEKLRFVGMVTVAAGLDHVVEESEGWRVVVRFTDGVTNTFAKVYIDDDGSIHQHVWDEPVPAEPVYQWVEVPGVGAVQFKLWTDGLIYVKDWQSECCELYDYNEGQPGETARVDFEGESVFVIIDVWPNAEGGLSWTVTDQPSS